MHRASDPVQVWQFKIRTLRKKIKGWSRNREVELKKKKANISSEIDGLDMLSEHQELTEAERKRRKELSLELDQIWMIEKIKHQSKTNVKRKIYRGRQKYYIFLCQSKPNKERKTISCLEDGDVTLTKDEETCSGLINKYKGYIHQLVNEYMGHASTPGSRTCALVRSSVMCHRQT
jgi:hypothetical protein